MHVWWPGLAGTTTKDQFENYKEFQHLLGGIQYCSMLNIPPAQERFPLSSPVYCSGRFFQTHTKSFWGDQRESHDALAEVLVWASADGTYWLKSLPLSTGISICNYYFLNWEGPYYYWKGPYYFSSGSNIIGHSGTIRS